MCYAQVDIQTCISVIVRPGFLQERFYLSADKFMHFAVCADGKIFFSPQVKNLLGELVTFFSDSTACPMFVFSVHSTGFLTAVYLSL